MATTTKKPAQSMEWTNEHDHCLCQEILVLEPFNAKKGSVTRGQTWDKIASNLNSLLIPRFRVTKRAVRERYNLLREKFKVKMNEEEKASGIETDMSEVEKALEEILEKEAVAEDTVESSKKKADNAKAVEMRNRAMESMSSTRKRMSAEDEDSDVTFKPKSTRRSGGDVFAYFREKNEKYQDSKARELELQRERLEVENKNHDEERKQHQDMMQVLVQQTKQQQDQMQSFQQMFTLMQQQQSQIIMRLLEKPN